MGLEISRDARGNVTIRDAATGKSETSATGVAGRPAQRTIADDAALPEHSWGQLPSHSWGRLS